jgi:MATE family multidrug resistance protein
MSPPAAPRALIPALLRIAAPVALARLGIMGMGLVDTIVVGQVAPDQLPLLALGWAPTGIFLVAGIGLLTGVQVLAARVIGEGDRQNAGAVWRKGLVISAGFGLAAGGALYLVAEPLLAALGVERDLVPGAAGVARVLAISIPLHFAYIACTYFLEAIQRPNAGTVVIWIANGLNLIGDLWLVPAYGAQGAALSTALSRVFMVASLAIWILLAPAPRAHGSRHALSPSSPTYRALFAVGFAAALSQLVEAGAFSGMTIIAGRIGAEAVAAYQILLNTLAAVFMIALGLCSATAVLVSDAYGRNDMPGAVRAGWTGLALNTGAMALAGVLLMVFAAPIAHGFTRDAAVAAIVIALIPLTALVPTPDGGQAVTAAALRARADNWFPTASHFLAYVLIMPPLGFYLGELQRRGVAGLMEAILIASVVSVSVLMIRLWLLSRAGSPALSSA